MIARDGNCTSIWQASVNPYKTRRTAKPGQVFNVIVVGAGITGITTALQLQQAGLKCLVLEAATIGFGTTSGTTAHLNTYMDTSFSVIEQNFGKEAPGQVAAAAADAIALIRENISANGIDCDFKEQSAFLFAQDESENKQLKTETTAAMDAGLQVMMADSIPVPFEFVGAIKVDGQAAFNPARYLYSLCQVFEDAGGVINENCRVLDTTEEGSVIVGTTAGKFACDNLVYATHIPPGINLLHLRCAPWRSYAMAVKLTDGNYPDALVYDMKDPYNYYRSQVLDGETYLIAGGNDHKTGDEASTETCFNKLEAHVRGSFKVSEIVHKWSSQYFEPADGLPYIGLLPGSAGHVYVATGYGGNGMVYSGVAARILRSLILKETNELAGLFSPSRIKPVAGFKNFISHNAHVASSMVKGWFSSEKIEGLADIARGEARVVRYEGNKIGIYKDEAGAIHAVDTTCTHMKCGVSWNTSEKSWDCPCHGARFSFDGKLLTGPASHDLTRIDIGEPVKTH